MSKVDRIRNPGLCVLHTDISITEGLKVIKLGIGGKMRRSSYFKAGVKRPYYKIQWPQPLFRIREITIRN